MTDYRVDDQGSEKGQSREGKAAREGKEISSQGKAAGA
jgi:hypothetical protein